MKRKKRGKMILVNLLLILIFAIPLLLIYFIGTGITGFVTFSVTTFSTNLSAENLTFDQPSTSSRTISINRDANITSATITLKGYRRYNYLLINKTSNPTDGGDGTREEILYGSTGTNTRNFNIPKYFYNITNGSMQVTGTSYQSTVNSELWQQLDGNTMCSYATPQWGSPGNNNSLMDNGCGRMTVLTPGSLYMTRFRARFNQGDGWTSGGCDSKTIKLKIYDVTSSTSFSDKTVCSSCSTAGEVSIDANYGSADGTFTSGHDYNFTIYSSDATISNCYRTYCPTCCGGCGSAKIRFSIWANNTATPPKDVAFDTGNDGKIDLNFTGTLTTTKYADINASAMISYLSTCSATNGNCSVPLKIYSNDQGNVTYSSINITLIGNYPINVTIDTNGSSHYTNLSTFNGTTTINLNVSVLQNSINNCSSPFGQDCSIYLNFSSSTDGILEYSSLNVLWNDIKPPFFANNITNATSTTPKFNDTVQINISALDGVNISRCLFSWNYTGIWENNTPFATNGTNVTLIFNQTLNVTRKPLVGIQVYCNDTSANRNQSDIFTIQVQDTAPTFNNTISAQSVAANTEFRFYLNASDVDLDPLTFSVNDTRFLSINATNGTLYGTPSSSFIGTSTINVTVSDGTLNNSLTFDLIVSDTLNPQWSGNATNANSSFPKYADVVQLNVTLTDNSALKNFTLTVDQNGIINNTNRTISGTSYVMSENVTVISPQGTVNKWNVTFYDSSGNINATSTFTFITASSSPQWSNNVTNASSSAPKFGDTIQLNLTISSNVNLKNYSLTLDQSGNISYTNRSISGSSYNIIENFSITSAQGTTNKWNVTFYDLGGGSNSTSTFTFLTVSSSPLWSSNITNANLSFPKKGEAVQMNVTITNNVPFTNYTFTFDQGGNLTILNRSINGISWIIIENFTISANQGTKNKWNVTFRDVGGGSNSTDTFILYTRNTPPTVTAFNITNDTTVNFNNKTYYVIGNGTFADSDSNNSLLNREIRWLNGSTVIPNENGFSLNCAQYSNSYCAVGQNISAQMRVSDNSGELSNLSDWNVSNFVIIDPIYPISFANLTAGNVSDNDGDGNIEINWTDDAVQINETYRLYRSTSKINSSNIGSATLIGSAIPEGTQFFKDNSTQNGTTYWYALVTVNQDGFFNESVLSLSFNATPNDTIKPKIPAGFNITYSSDTATLSWANVTQDINGNPDNFGLQYVIYYGTSFNSSKELANESITSPSTKTVSGNSTTISVTSSGTYHFIVTTLDDGANKNLSVFLTQNYGNASLTVSSSSTSSSSSGGGGGGGGGGSGGASSGGGGGGGVPDTTSSGYFYQSLTNNIETTLKVPASKTISISKITFTPIKDLSSVTIDIKEHTDSTTPVTISADAYQYIEINLNGVKNTDISNIL